VTAAYLEPYRRETRRLLPAGAEVVDVHTHLGLDEDGMSLERDELLGQLDDAGIARACVFPLHDPARRPAYRGPNDRVLAWAAASGGRLLPFCRLDPGDDPVGEGERCLERGAVGIKLHPRAQAFHFGEGIADPIFELAGRAGVPILIHAGRGMPHHFADGLVAVANRFPDVPLILAHLGVADMGTFAAGLREHPSVLYDTSWFNPVEHLELLARVPAERVVFGSDPPYGRPASGLFLLLRVARFAGIDDETVRGMIGGTVAGLLRGEGVPPARPPCRPADLTVSGRLLRLHNYCLVAFGSVFGGDRARGAEMLSLALAACRDPEPGDCEAVFARAVPVLEAARSLLLDDEIPSGRQALAPVLLVMADAVTEPPGAAAGAGPPAPVH
jgi:predicted TIM-barrel fold metal-dependent hydrolase